MQWTKRYTSGQRIHFVYVFLFGFFIGVFLMNLWKNILITGTGFLDEEMLYQMKYTQIDVNNFFYYVLQKRLALFAGLAVLATTYLGLVTTYGAFWWFGFAGGMFMAAAAIRYGIKGILLLAAALLPQYFLYVPAFWLLLNWCYRICCTMYFPAKIYSEPEKQFRSKKAFFITHGLQLLILLLVVIIGICLESYVNPIFITKLLKKF